MAQKLSDAITKCGYTLTAPTESNQIFPILPDKLIESLKERYDFYLWGKADDQHSVVRMVTSWATDEKQVDALIHEIKNGLA
jgi:threonine aldolase